MKKLLCLPALLVIYVWQFMWWQYYEVPVLLDQIRKDETDDKTE